MQSFDSEPTKKAFEPAVFQGYDHGNNLTVSQRFSQNVGNCYFNMGNLIEEYKHDGSFHARNFCKVPHVGNDYGNCDDGVSEIDAPKIFEAQHGMADDSGTGWVKKEHQLQDDCGKIQICEVHEDKIIWKQIECGKVKNQAEAHFETFSGPCGGTVSLNNGMLLTPIFEIKRDDCHGPSGDKQNEVYADINQSKTLYFKNKNKPAGGINIVLNNEVNASSSNNISQNQSANPNMSMNNNQAAPAQVGMPAAGAVAAAAAGGREGSAVEDADEMVTCKEGPMGFQIDWDAPKKTVNKVNKGSWAEKKEIEVGDTIIAVNGEDATAMSKDDMVQKLANTRPIKLALKKRVDVPDTF